MSVQDEVDLALYQALQAKLEEKTITPEETKQLRELGISPAVIRYNVSTSAKYALGPVMSIVSLFTKNKFTFDRVEYTGLPFEYKGDKHVMVIRMDKFENIYRNPKYEIPNEILEAPDVASGVSYLVNCVLWVGSDMFNNKNSKYHIDSSLEDLAFYYDSQAAINNISLIVIGKKSTPNEVNKDVTEFGYGLAVAVEKIE